jgi:hypothetical protein
MAARVLRKLLVGVHARRYYCTNSPSSWHGGLFQKLKAKVPQGYRLVGDSAFPRGDANCICPGKIIRCRKEDEPPPDTEEEEEVEKELTACRQSTEWGMRAVQTQCHRLQAGDLPDEEIMKPHRRILLVTCFLLYNYRTRKTGLNQLRSFWMALLPLDGMKEVYG